MKKKTFPLILIGVVILIVLGVVVGKAVSKPASTNVLVSEPTPEPTLAPVPDSVLVTAKWSKAQANAVVIKIAGLASKYTNLSYELTYESQGLIKGVNSGSKPVDISGKDSFEREIYLGTCSRNVCKPDLGVKQVTVVLEFTDKSGQKTQFNQDFTL